MDNCTTEDGLTPTSPRPAPSPFISAALRHRKDPPLSERSIFLFDLDGVLSRRDTLGFLVVLRLRRRPVRAVVCAAMSLVSLACLPYGRFRPGINRAIVGVALNGVSPAEYHSLAARTVRRLIGDSRTVSSEAISAVRWATSEGQAFVVTGSEGQLARRYLQEIGLQGVHVQASALSVSDGGARLTHHNVGAAKVMGLRAAGVDLAEATLYTDSAADLELARAVRHTVLVNPSWFTRFTLARRNCSFQVVRWR